MCRRLTDVLARQYLEIDKKAPTSTLVGVGAFIVFVDLLLLPVIIERHKASIKRYINHPVLLLVREHGVTKPLQLRIVCNESMKRFRLHINLCFYLNRYDTIAPLRKEINLYR